MTNPTSAANAYASLAKLVAPGAGMDKAAGLGSAAGGGDKSFGSMLKVASNQMDYQAATTLYSKSLGLVKTAIGKR